MNTIKELKNRDELVKHIVEDLDDFEEDTVVSYEVWAIGYDPEDNVTDAETFFASFDSPDEAIEYAQKITLPDIVCMTPEDDTETDYDISYISVEVETVVKEDEESFNVGTIFKNTIWISDEEGPAEDPEETNVVLLSSEDYTLNEDGSIDISCELLKNYNKNDRIQVMFVDEDNQPILTYKIISKTTANKYVCEFIY